MIHVAIFGYGTVGTGVAEVLVQNAERLTSAAGSPVAVKYILERAARPDVLFADKITQDIEQILADPEVSIVIECIGGQTAALDFVKRAILAGKHVVTSNKELVAAHGVELIALARARNLNFLFEAAVGGGIPIIRPLSQCLAANEITEICGILNGTTNYILTQMEAYNQPFDAALQGATEEGYAEADPTDDIDGHDACRKICILASLAFGRHVYPETVRVQGISHVTTLDMQYAKAAGFAIKLLGRAKRQNDKTICYVAPHLVAQSRTLSNVDGVFNAVLFHGNVVGDVLFYGQGAGKLPTASAMVADVVDVCRHLHARRDLGWTDSSPDHMGDSDDLITPWYVRGEQGIEANFSPFAPIPLEHAEADSIAFLTEPMCKSELNSKLPNRADVVAFRLLE